MGSSPLIVLAEAPEQLEQSASSRDIAAMTEAARIAGARIYTIPPDFSRCEHAEGALWHVPEQAAEVRGVWIGFIPSPDRYREIYDAALRRRIVLVNSPDEHLTAQEFDRAYPRLGELTPDSLIISSVDQCAGAIAKLGTPVFVKGAVQSRKAKGWKACVAESESELRTLTEQLLALDNRSRGRVVVRKLVQLRASRTSAEGFPFGREYRVFVLDRKTVGWGYYWEGEDTLKALSAPEQRTVLALAEEASRRLAVPSSAASGS
jgi:hypothetical protein